MGDPRPAVWTFGPAADDAQSFTLSSSGFSARVTTEGYVLSMPGQAASAASGAPDVPTLAVLRSGRLGRTARVEVEPPSWTEIPGIRIAPVESRVLDDVTTNAPTYRMGRIPSLQIYGEDRFWPPVIAQVQEAWMGTAKTVRIECRLIQYNPVRHVVRYCRELQGRIVFAPAEGPSTR